MLSELYFCFAALVTTSALDIRHASNRLFCSHLRSKTVAKILAPPQSFAQVQLAVRIARECFAVLRAVGARLKLLS